MKAATESPKPPGRHQGARLENDSVCKSSRRSNLPTQFEADVSCAIRCPRRWIAASGFGDRLCPALDALLTQVDLAVDRAGVGPTQSRTIAARYRSGVFGASDGLT
jgi:hypothetical protein